MEDFLEACFSLVVIAVGIVVAIGLVYFLIGISPLILLLVVIGGILYVVWEIIKKLLNLKKTKI